MSEKKPVLITSTIKFAQQVVANTVCSGDTVIDATAGNGNDTVFLARLVGEKGLVHAFDVQEYAIKNTSSRLARHNFSKRACLYNTGHENLAKIWQDEINKPVKAVMFNLGYLPGSSQSKITSPETTVKALNAALPLLAPGGVITIICYCGHPGGAEESLAVEKWCSALDIKNYHCLHYEIINKASHAIRLYCVQHDRPCPEKKSVNRLCSNNAG